MFRQLLKLWQNSSKDNRFGILTLDFRTFLQNIVYLTIFLHNQASITYLQQFLSQRQLIWMIKADHHKLFIPGLLIFVTKNHLLSIGQFDMLHEMLYMLMGQFYNYFDAEIVVYQVFSWLASVLFEDCLDYLE